MFFRRFGTMYRYSLSLILPIFQEDFLLFAEIDVILQILEKVLEMFCLFVCLFVCFFSFILCGVPVKPRYDLQT